MIRQLNGELGIETIVNEFRDRIVGGRQLPAAGREYNNTGARPVLASTEQALTKPHVSPLCSCFQFVQRVEVH